MSALVEVTDNKVNHSAGCGLEIPCNIFFWLIRFIYIERLKTISKDKKRIIFLFLAEVSLCRPFCPLYEHAHNCNS